MSLTNAAQRSRPVGLPCDEILRIAHRDAAAVYRDLADFRITLELRPDGWHVDYDLTAPTVAGGGPHYVIDPETGQIVSKRYEQ
jgi:hypothetical protein